MGNDGGPFPAAASKAISSASILFCASILLPPPHRSGRRRVPYIPSLLHPLPPNRSETWCAVGWVRERLYRRVLDCLPLLSSREVVLLAKTKQPSGGNV